MKLNILAFRDKALGCYTQPFYTDVPTENVITAQTRAIISSTPEKRVVWSHKQLLKLGEFEDTTGLITPQEPEYLMDCDDVLAQFELKEVIKNGEARGESKEA